MLDFATESFLIGRCDPSPVGIASRGFWVYNWKTLRLSHRTARHPASLLHCFATSLTCCSSLTMPAGPIEQLTAEQSMELVLTLAGRLQAAMAASLEECENAQARTMDMLVSWIQSDKSSTKPH